MRAPRWTVACAALALVAAVGVLAAGCGRDESVPATPSSVRLAAGGDVRGDVALTRYPGLDPATRRSVDLTALSVSTRSGAVRFTVTGTRGIASAKLRQLFFIDFDSPTSDLNGQLQLSTADADGSMTVERTEHREGYVVCEPLRTSLEDGVGTWWVDVPRRCLPTLPMKLSVYAQTIATDGSGEQFSYDRLTLPGLHDLHGLAAPLKR